MSKRRLILCVGCLVLCAAGLAVVFAEMGFSNYTGIGISCGSGLCNVCFSVLSVPVIQFKRAEGRRLHRHQCGERDRRDGDGGR